jgi:hypothetical protein
VIQLLYECDNLFRAVCGGIDLCPAHLAQRNALNDRRFCIRHSFRSGLFLFPEAQGLALE